jgi:Tfp pilus assembly protein PilF
LCGSPDADEFLLRLPRRATAYTSLGEKEKATADLKKALMLEPGNKQAKDDLATLAMTPEV